MLQPVQPLTGTDFFFCTPKCRDYPLSSVLELTYSNILQAEFSFMITAFKQITEDSLLQSVITTPTTRENLVNFTGDIMSKPNHFS